MMRSSVSNAADVMKAADAKLAMMQAYPASH
jgi:hypothetical protein